MNIELLPEEVKNDIEDQSLSILDRIKEDIIIIGGWAVRAHLGEMHQRYTLDVDGVTDSKNLYQISTKLNSFGFHSNEPEWGNQFLKKYKPSFKVSERLLEEIDRIEIRIKISEPRIKEYMTPHYFEFSLTNFVRKNIPYHNSGGMVRIKVPPIEDMAAVKLGLPVDYKNNHDAAMLLANSDLKEVIRSISDNDNWKDMVIRRIPKLKGRISQKGRLENTLALAAGLDIKDHTRKLDMIRKALEKVK